MKQRKNIKTARHGLETLEDRRLLSSVVLNGAAMELHGDAKLSNSFLVRAASDNRVLGFANNFGTVASLDTIQEVVIYTGGETDTVTVAPDVTARVEVIEASGRVTWLQAGSSQKFNGSSDSDNAPSNSGGTGHTSDGSSSTGTGSSSTGNGSSSTGSGTSSTGSGSSSTGSGSSSTGSGSSSTGSGSSSSGSGSSSTGTGSSSTGTGSSSTGTGSSSSGTGSSSTGTGSSSTGTGSSSTGTGSSSTGTGSSSTGTGSSSTGTGSSSTGTGSSSTGTGSSSTGTGSSSTGTGSSSTGTGSSSTGTGSTGTGSGTSSTPSNPSDPATPKAVITLTSPTSILPEESVNVQAVKSNFGSGTAINSTIAWNFGDAGSSYNNLVGFNAAHAYANAGTYTITLTITTPDGHVGIATQQVTVSADTRQTIYVAANGSDSNNGLSANTPIQSVSRLAQLITSNTRVLFQAGDTFDFSTGVAVNVGGLQHVYIGAYGSGAKPILFYNGSAGQGVFIGISGSTSSLVVQGLTFDTRFTNNDDQQAIPSVFSMQGNDITILDNTFLNVLNDMAAPAVGPTNVLVQDNASPSATALSAYFYFVGGSDIVILGNTVADSWGEAVLRVGGANDLLIADNNFTEVPQAGTGGGKNVLSIQEGTYAYIVGNNLNTGPVEVGPIGTPTQDPNSFFQYAVFDSNTLANGSNFVINPGAHDVMDKNNVIDANGNTAFTVNAQEVSGGINWQVQDLYLQHNTVIDSGMWGGFLSINNGEAQGIHIDNNLFIDPTFETGFGEAFIKVDENDMNSFAEIKNNVWSVPAVISSYANGGEFFIASDVSDPSGWLTPAEWEATGIPTGDVYQNVNLGASYSINIDGFTAGSSLANAA